MESPHGAAVKAEDFGLKGPRGWVFRGVGIDAAPGSLIALEGPSGSGRTCLLLALTGRMKPSEGRAEIGGHPLPKKMTAVRRIAALGHVPGVNDLDEALTVAEQLREGAMLQRRYEGPVRALFRPRSERRAAAANRIEEALAAAGLDPATLPKGPRTSVRDLERLEAVRLSVAIALLGGPRLLALDDTDLKLSTAERAELWALLRSIADRGTTVLAVCNEAPEGVLVLRTVEPTAEPTTALAGSPAPAVRSGGGAEPAITWGAKPDGTAEPADEPEPQAAPEADPDTRAGTEPESDAEPDTGEDGDPATPAATTDTDDDTKGTDDALAEARRA
ncbi:ATP-binding cassette domain-containing protein [Streptomyces sp. H27-G5]|uniref:ATP-binding cassette domain-containing protein n=1 Tax=Streptomyces sp. H27-G5 TaxID=2996698 RepID=UPI002271A38F|nr:ATP-binding cassette domain-containing protein [Streptomyces sp. H27-G5]MCY0917893.1 ATP-binding cassette domain-containing protein [Streptomyces sp. H27-G5]